MCNTMPSKRKVPWAMRIDPGVAALVDEYCFGGRVAMQRTTVVEQALLALIRQEVEDGRFRPSVAGREVLDGGVIDGRTKSARRSGAK